MGGLTKTKDLWGGKKLYGNPLLNKLISKYSLRPGVGGIHL